MKDSILFWQLTAVLVFLSLIGKSQENSVKITSERNEDQSVDFFYEKEDFGSFFLNLTFTHLENAIPTTYKGGLAGTSGKFLSIKPMSQNSSIGYSYTYTYIRGVLNPKIDASFVYLLPVSKGNTIKAFELSNLEKTYLGNTEPKGWKAFQFLVKPGDTVFSSRKGLIVEVTDGYEAETIADISYKSKENAILMEHEDGTLARYSVLKKGSIMVKPGQTVFPHTPLALAGTYDLESNTQVRFFVYYLSEYNLENPEKLTLATKKNYYAFVNPIFHTSDGDVHLKSMQDYTADFTNEHILKELSKREKKKLGK